MSKSIDKGIAMWYNRGWSRGSQFKIPQQKKVNKMKAITMEVSTIVAVIATGVTGVVTEIAKGWVTVTANGESKKYRAKQLEVMELEAPKKSQAETLKEYRKGYRVSVTGNGRKSQASVLSAVAMYWEGNDHGKVAQWAAILLNEETLAFYNKYSHLNNGQMRMNSGNRVNAAVKRGEISTTELEAVMEAEITPTLELDSKFRPERLAK